MQRKTKEGAKMTKSLRKYMSNNGRKGGLKGGAALLKKRGTDHFSEISKKRWKKEKGNK